MTTFSRTSLTVPPWALRIRFTSSSSTRATATRRCRPTGAFSGLFGAGSTAERAVRSSPPAIAVSAGGGRPDVGRPRPGRSRRRRRPADVLVERLQHQLGAGRGPLRRPLDRIRRRRVRLDVEQHLADVDRAEPVDQRRVGLGHHRHAAARQALHQVGLPERPVPVQRSRGQPGDQVQQLRLRARAAAGRTGGGGRRCRTPGRPPTPGSPGDPAPPPPAAGSAAPATGAPRPARPAPPARPGGASRISTPPTCMGVPGSSRYRNEASSLLSRSTIDLLPGGGLTLRGAGRRRQVPAVSRPRGSAAAHVVGPRARERRPRPRPATGAPRAAASSGATSASVRPEASAASVARRSAGRKKRTSRPAKRSSAAAISCRGSPGHRPSPHLVDHHHRLHLGQHLAQLVERRGRCAAAPRGRRRSRTARCPRPRAPPGWRRSGAARPCRRTAPRRPPG